MIFSGLEQEAKNLEPQKDCVALKTVGYREFFDFFEKTCTKEEAIEKIKQNTRNYAKKQITWLKRKNDCTWFLPTDLPQIITHITTEIEKK